MSFAGKVKEELLEQVGKAKHCQIAELAAIFALCGQVIMEENGQYSVKFTTENLTVAKKCYMLIKRVLRSVPDVSVVARHTYHVYLTDNEDAENFMRVIRVMDGALLAADGLLDKACCKRAFLRGVFMVAGSVADPNSGYQLEIVLASQGRAIRIQEIMGVFDLEVKTILRKNKYIVYMKDGASIVDFLNVIGAHVALMEFENVRILREMRNSINRQVNCETANIKKIVSAASKQTADIQYIHDTIGFGNLSENLSQVAKVRLDNPELPLKELGQMLEPPIGKSGVNHRLRKLSEIANDLRKQNGGKYD